MRPDVARTLRRIGAVLILAVFAGSALGAMKTWNAGDQLTANDLNANFKDLDDRLKGLETKRAVEVVYIRDFQPSGTPGGSAASNAWVPRVLNDIVNPAGHAWVSLNANKVTLAAGRYEIIATVPVHHGNRAQARLRNVSDNKVVLSGSSGILGWADQYGSAAVTGTSVLMGQFVVPGPQKKDFQIETNQEQTGCGACALGYASARGGEEVYTQLRLARLDD